MSNGNPPKIANEVVGAKRLTRTYLCNLGLVETFPKTSVAVFYAFCVSKLFFLEVGILFPANAHRCLLKNFCHSDWPQSLNLMYFPTSKN